MKKSRSSLYKHSGPYFFVALFAIFFVLTATSNNQNWFTAAISLPLIFFYPGYLLSRMWKITLPWATRLSLSTVFSVATHLGLLSIFKDYIPLNAGALATYLLLINALIALVYWQFFHQRQQADTLPYDRLDYLIAALPLLFFIINFLISPLISEGDSYYFIYAAMDSFSAGRDISPYINRPGFIPFLGLLNLAGGESFLFIFRVLLPALFYISILMLFDHLRMYSKNYTTSRWLYLLILAAPVLTTEVDIARTQSLVFAFSVPVLILLSRFLADKKTGSLIIATFLAAIGTRIHELSYVLLFTCVLTTALYGFRNLLEHTSRRKTAFQIAKFLGIALLVAYPYFLLLFSDASFAFIRNSTSTILSTIFHPQWTWWFLSSYTTDGWQLGWSGIQAVFYYLYNGILLLLAGGLLLIATKKRIRWSLALPPLIFSLVYFSVAEIFPRMNLFYYPNRAWPHFVIGFVLLIASLTMEMRWRSNWLRVITIIALTGSVLAGIGGWVRLTFDKGGFYMRQEVQIRNYIRDELPDDAVIYTPQSSNQAIIRVYGNKHSVYIPYQTTFTDSSPTHLLKIALRSQQDQEATKADTTPYQKRTVITSRSGAIISETIEVLPPTVISIPEPTTTQGHLYLYYSFARFNGYMGQREWWRLVNSHQNYNFFKQFPEGATVYRDEAGIIIKLQ